MRPEPWEVWTAIFLLTIPTVFCIGYFDGIKHAKTEAPIISAPRPAVVHPSGDISIERTAAPPPKALDLAPGTDHRIRSIVVDLAPLPKTETVEHPRELQIDTQEGKDGTRVTLKGEGILGAEQFEIPRPPPPKLNGWTAGATWDGRNYGPVIGYQWNRLNVGAYATRNTHGITAVWRF